MGLVFYYKMHRVLTIPPSSADSESKYLPKKMINFVLEKKC